MSITRVIFEIETSQGTADLIHITRLSRALGSVLMLMYGLHIGNLLEIISRTKGGIVGHCI
ncbi:MAG: hypothetical protein ACW98W_05095 [Candidatus Hodarchaeales archaeon]